ncbi:PREDICTED: TNF receptor-associated factor 6-like [Amphimedon queenslandica]|uniref:RING-type E3 ubiquitin transferase n=1 Tax=Amphimedon queenslandica TaxID=400682 RepID=A0A1X7UKB0_AMPQE|nr:PREDICTED: TNF receptor-associated factor 6-like [Amphimedon queenslandica]|eukprot:XP_011404877.1 PREDICTED: TNF receptor-associated factor 6-like [Amphimedon queenslandica]
MASNSYDSCSSSMVDRVVDFDITSFDFDEPHYVDALPKGLDTTCSICFAPLHEDPFINIDCGHHFCGSCTSRITQCPECRCILRAVTDKGLRRTLLSLQVYCNKKNEGCAWKGDLGELGSHRNDCLYVNIQCSACSNDVLKCQIDKHRKEECPFRPANCEHCGVDCSWLELHEIHIDECSLCPLTCLCGKIIPRGEMERHEGFECPKATVVCEAHKYGCTWEGPREDHEKHFRDNWISHFSRMCDRHCDIKVEMTEEKIQKCMEDISGVQSDIDNCRKELSKKMEHAIDKSNKELSNQVESAQVRIDRCKENIRDLRIDKDEEINLLYKLSQEKIDECMKEIGDLKNEIEEKNETILSLDQRISDLEVIFCDHVDLYLRMSELQKRMEEEMSIILKKAETAAPHIQKPLEPPSVANMEGKMDMVLKKAETTAPLIQKPLEPPPVAAGVTVAKKSAKNKSKEHGDNAASKNIVGEAKANPGCPAKPIMKEKPSCTYILNFPSAQGKVPKEVYSSPQFYAGFYKMRLRVHPYGCGNGKGQYLSVYICLVKGKYDEEFAEWPFRGKVTVELEHNANGKPHSKTIIYHKHTPESFSTVDVETQSSKGNGLPTFLAHTELDQYMKLNRLVFKVYVKVNV